MATAWNFYNVKRFYNTKECYTVRECYNVNFATAGNFYNARRFYTAKEGYIVTADITRVSSHFIETRPRLFSRVSSVGFILGAFGLLNRSRQITLCNDAVVPRRETRNPSRYFAHRKEQHLGFSAPCLQNIFYSPLKRSPCKTLHCFL